MANLVPPWRPIKGIDPVAPAAIFMPAFKNSSRCPTRPLPSPAMKPPCTTFWSAYAAAAMPPCACGGAAKIFHGLALEGTPLELRPLRGIISYEPTELVVTARAGTPLQGAAGHLVSPSRPGL